MPLTAFGTAGLAPLPPSEGLAERGSLKGKAEINLIDSHVKGRIIQVC